MPRYLSLTFTNAVVPSISQVRVSNTTFSPFSFGEGCCDATKQQNHPLTFA